VTDIIRPFLTIIWKDILLETRSKDIIISMLVFSILVLVIFNFALEPSPQLVALISPGILWVAFIFGGVLGLTRSFAVEKDQGNLQGLILTPVSRDTIYFGKMLAIFLFMLIVQAIVLPIFMVLFNLSILEPLLIPVIVLATLGIAATGTLFSSIAINTRAREVMLPVLFFPVALPIIVAAVEATGLVIGNPNLADLIRWLSLLVVFDAVFLVVCPFAFSIIVDD